MEEQKIKPAQKYRMGSVTATIWKRTAQKGEQTFTMYDTVIENNYKDKEGEWKSSSKFNLNDLASVSMLSLKSYEWIRNDKQTTKE